MAVLQKLKLQKIALMKSKLIMLTKKTVGSYFKKGKWSKLVVVEWREVNQLNFINF